MKITKNEIAAINNITEMLRGEELSEVELKRSLALTYLFLSQAMDECEEKTDDLPSDADFFDKAVEMALSVTHTVKKWEKQTGMLTYGMIVKADVHPVVDEIEGEDFNKPMVRIAIRA